MPQLVIDWVTHLPDFASLSNPSRSFIAVRIVMALGHAAHYSDNGSIHFVCRHWGKIRELLAAAADLFSETKNLCINKR
jgi:hypothetical protein